jgi:hypothetical protein
MKPFMKFSRGKGAGEQFIYVNMNQVCYIATDGAAGSVLTFSAVIGEEPAYLCVNESPDEIAKRLPKESADG